MKTRILLYVASLIAWTGIWNLFVQPTSIVVRNAAAVATVNGGDVDFVAQQALEHASHYGWYGLGLLVLTALFWIPSFVRNLNKVS